MLEEYKSIFRQSANRLPDWEQLSKNELCRKYVECENNSELQNSYLSAIMLRYWNLIGKYYYMSSNAATVEDCYEWLEDSVCYVLREASWKNTSKSLFNDPNGPDKAINRCMKCARLTHYQYINRKKRRDNFGMLSLDELSETFGRSTVEPIDHAAFHNIQDVGIKEFVIQLFNKKDYFLAFMIDCIVFGNVFETAKEDDGNTYSTFNLKRLVKMMSHLDLHYLRTFSFRYNIEPEDVDKGFSYCSQLSTATIKRKIVNRLDELKHDKFIKLLRKG